jgi:flagellin-like protein
MRKGVSAIISVILIILITVSLIALVYQWLSGQTTQTQSELGRNAFKSEGCLKIENIDTRTNKIIVRNCGDIDLNNIVLFVDSKPVVNYQGTLLAGNIAQINYALSLGEHEILLTSNYAESSRMIIYVS